MNNADKRAKLWFITEKLRNFFFLGRLAGCWKIAYLEVCESYIL